MVGKRIVWLLKSVRIKLNSLMDFKEFYYYNDPRKWPRNNPMAWGGAIAGGLAGGLPGAALGGLAGYGAEKFLTWARKDQSPYWQGYYAAKTGHEAEAPEEFNGEKLGEWGRKLWMMGYYAGTPQGGYGGGYGGYGHHPHRGVYGQRKTPPPEAFSYGVNKYTGIPTKRVKRGWYMS